MGVCVRTEWLTPEPDVHEESLAAAAPDDWERAGLPEDRRSRAELTEIAREIVEHLRRTHRRPGARLSISKLDDRFGTDPAVAAALSELVDLGYVEHPDAHTIELTARGFDAAHRPDAD
jgi:hypothetical protein